MERPSTPVTRVGGAPKAALVSAYSKPACLTALRTDSDGGPGRHSSKGRIGSKSGASGDSLIRRRRSPKLPVRPDDLRLSPLPAKLSGRRRYRTLTAGGLRLNRTRPSLRGASGASITPHHPAGT